MSDGYRALGLLTQGQLSDSILIAVISIQTFASTRSSFTIKVLEKLPANYKEYLETRKISTRIWLAFKVDLCLYCVKVDFTRLSPYRFVI